jgi:hypothetical protein
MEPPMRLALVAASLALAACATISQQASVDLDSGLSALVGQRLEVAVARLGEPIGSARLGADTVYGWGSASTSTEILHPTPGFIDAANYQGGVFPPPRRTVENACLIRMIVDAQGVIRTWDHQGNEAGCRAYAARLT